MKHFFLDTNVALDFLLACVPHNKPAGRLFAAAKRGTVKLYMSALSFPNMHYIIRREDSGVSDAKAMLEVLLGRVECIALEVHHIAAALKSDARDFEDVLQYRAALSVLGTLTGIVTRNPKDFRQSTIRILSPVEAVELIKAP